MIRLDFASFKYSVSKSVIRKLKKNIKNVNLYPDENYSELKNALVNSFGYKKENYILGNGLDEVIDIISRAFLKKNDEVLIPTPTFSQYELAAKRIGAKINKINCLVNNNYEVNSDIILSNISSKTKIIWLCSPNNPTGGVISKFEIEKILFKTKKLVVIDEALVDFSNQNFLSLIKKYSNLIVLRTFSKGYALAGLRIGFGVSNKKIISKLLTKKQIFNVNGLAVLAAQEALNDQKYYKKLWRKFRKERNRLIFELEKLKIKIIGKESNFLLLDFKSKARNYFVYEELLKRNIKIFLGSNEEFSGLSGKYSRVVVSTKKENKFFVKVLKEILRYKE